MSLATAYLDARYAAHVARRDGAPPLVRAIADAHEATTMTALASQPGRHVICDLFAIEVREGPVRRQD